MAIKITKAKSPIVAAQTKAELQTLPNTHPYRDAKNEKKLLDFVRERLDSTKQARDTMLTRLRDIDIQVSGFIKLDEEDKKRDIDNKVGKAAKATKMNLPLVMAQIDEMQTFLLTVFAPDGELFQAIAAPDRMDLAKAFARYTNTNGQRVDYFGEFSKFLNNMLKYNIGAMTALWEDRAGQIVGNDESGNAKIKDAIVWQGNVLQSLDMYNFLYDNTVHPTKLASDGEWFATVSLNTKFRARKMEKDRELFNVARFADDISGVERIYYRGKPSVRDNTTSGIDFSWDAWWMNDGNPELQPGIEIVRFITWLTPADFGISDSKEMELYQIKMCNGRFIGQVQKLDGTAALLPIGVSTPIIDDLDNNQRTYAEQLLPLQHFSSFLLNSHVDATRKALFGIKVYDQTVFGRLDKQMSDLVSGWIPTKAGAIGTDLNKAFRQFNDVPATQNNVADVGRMNELMQLILPTNMSKNIVDLDRATMYQAAAAVQATNRRALKLARVVLGQALIPIKTIMIYNTYQNQDVIDTFDDAGKPLQLNPKQIREAKVEYDLADGLQGLDRLLIMNVYQQLIQMVLQSQQAMAETDIIKLLDHFTSLAGDKTDFTAFRRVGPAPATPGQAAAGQSPVTPGSPEQPALQ